MTGLTGVRTWGRVYQMVPGRVPSGAARPSSARSGSGPEGRALCGGGLPAKVTVSPVLSEGGSIYIAFMIIWRGWGILGLFVTLAGVFGSLTVVEALLGTSESALALGGGIGFLLAGVANFFLGRWLNIIRPAQNAEDFRNQLRADLWERVANDAFQMAPGAPEPSSEAEAAQQIEQVVAGESRNAERAGRNIHTFFFIPLQWLGALECIGGLVFSFYSPFAG